MKDSSVLLQRRQNTGYNDGKWDIAGSGHVDEGETAKAAAVRECREELGITVKPEDLSFAHLSHRLEKDRTYYDIYFLVNAYTGVPAIMEPEKSSDIKWFAVENLPEDIIGCRREDVRNFLERILYSEKAENKNPTS